MKKAFIVMPMAGLSDDKVRENFERYTEYARKEGYEPIASLFAGPEWEGRPSVDYLLESLRLIITQAEVVLLAPGYAYARGCVIEEAVAHACGGKHVVDIDLDN